MICDEFLEQLHAILVKGCQVLLLLLIRRCDRPFIEVDAARDRRAIAVDPEIILMDEPCSALDPIATARIEELIDELRNNFTILIVTHSMKQAARVSQKTAFFHLGDMIEFGETEQIFTNPKDSKTQDYITGRFG